MEKDKAERMRRKIIKWYAENGRSDLPWRATENPWSVLVAVMLLRKTTANQVLDIYNDFLEKYPEPGDLKNTSLPELREFLKPLGMENERARIFKTLSEVIENNYGGKVPCSADELMDLPGVGRYTASEVLLTACGQPEPLLDRNMIRMTERFFGVSSNKKRPRTDKDLWSFAERLLPEKIEDVKAFNFGVLDFAGVVCRARKPLCEDCILKSDCHFFKSSSC